MKKITVEEMNFISNLFGDAEVDVCFKETTSGTIVSFIPEDEEDFTEVVVLYTGKMRTFLSVISDIYVSDYSALCNLSTTAKNALLFIK